MLKSRESQVLVTPAVRGQERRCNKVAEQQQQRGKSTQASLLFLIPQVSCSRKTSKYGKPFMLHPAAGCSSLAFG